MFHAESRTVDTRCGDAAFFGRFKHILPANFSGSNFVILSSNSQSWGRP